MIRPESSTPGETNEPEASARAEIESVIRESLEATRTMDIERYMATIPAAFRLTTPEGQPATREQLRADILQQWSIILRITELSAHIESMVLDGDASAAVITAQRYGRVMRTRDGRSTNDVLTTQRHHETWQRLPEGWRCVHIQELGGEIFVDGQAYDPGPEAQRPEGDGKTQDHTRP